jgi:NAD(P)-dependent dehydrogenase (short-subunit alcohol dehydrogenase family)
MTMAVDTDRVAVVTGASSGIGKEAAKALAARGWHVIAVGRNPGRSAAAEAEISASAGGPVNMIVGDLALMADAARIAREIEGLTDRVHVLINNAGGIASRRVITDEGYEQNFAGNHLGPFLLTNRLLPLLLRAAATGRKGIVRILNTSSEASESPRELPWDDLQMLENFHPGLAYCHAKLANMLFTQGLASRLAEDGIVAHAVHPGTVDTNFASHADEGTQAYIRSLDLISPAEGADTLIWLATAEEGGATSGGYYCERKPRAPNPLANDSSVVERLWKESERLVARSGA